MNEREPIIFQQLPVEHLATHFPEALQGEYETIFHILRDGDLANLQRVPEIIEGGLAGLFAVDETQDHIPQLSFGFDSLWKALYQTRYRKVQLSQPDEMYVTITPREPEATTARIDYYLPLAKDNKLAVAVKTSYQPTEILHRSGRKIRKLGRNTLALTTKPIGNPFYQDPKTSRKVSNLGLASNHMYKRIGNGNLGGHKI